MPHATTLSKNFIAYKKGEAKFNLAASEFGNSFGDWLLYLGKKNDDGTFSKVFLFNKKQQEEILIAAKEAKVINDGGVLRLKLYDGEGYSYSKEKLSQINFDTMFINDTMIMFLEKYQAPFYYWFHNNGNKQRIKHLLIRNTIMSLFPILTLFLIVAIGVVHVRHQKGRIYFYLFVTVLLYYGSLIALEKPLGFYTIPVMVVLWLSLSYFIYRKTIVQKF